MIRFLLVTLGLFFCLPVEAFAWGPSAHLNFGMHILDNISLLPQNLQSLLSFHKHQYLYGCISADITIGKKYFIAYRYHCHNWQVGMDLLQKAKQGSMRAFIFGYLSHLAADTVAHNLFVPVKVVEAYAYPARGHLYWELIFDKYMNDAHILDMFYALSRNPFEAEDQFLRNSLKPTLFSFATNKRIFNGLLLLQRLKRWQKLMERASKHHVTPLDTKEVEHYREMCINATLSLLIDMRESRFFRLDPTGDKALQVSRQQAKALRRQQNEQSYQKHVEKLTSDFERTLAGEAL